MNTYFELDPIIEKWVEILGSKLFTEFGGEPCRSFYTPGDPPFEVFQIWVDAPKNGRTSVHVGAVDTNDDKDAELEECWEGPVEGLDGMLANAVKTIDAWKVRIRHKPDPPSPW